MSPTPPLAGDPAYARARAQYASANPNLKSCPSCFGAVAKSARTCPHCGQKMTTGNSLVLAIVIGLILGGWAISSYLQSAQDENLRQFKQAEEMHQQEMKWMEQARSAGLPR